MKGQWLGRYGGDVEGRLMINIDEIKDHFEGVAYITPDNRQIPASVAYIATENKNLDQETVACLNAINPNTGYQCEWEEIKHLFPEGTDHARQATLHLNNYDNKLIIDAVSDIGVKYKSELSRPNNENESKIKGVKKTWKDYKSYVSKLTNAGYLFRGQEKPWKLITSFHRKERFRINQFIREDIKKLHRYLSAKTSHFFDLSIPDQNGAFFNLVQHYGYPTPLLDWSYSPYVAAFFAFRNLKKNYCGDEDVRIYLFNNEAWGKTYPPVQNIDSPFPHLSVMEFIALDNERLIPQQSVTTVSNIEDIEGYVIHAESNAGEQYLQAIDIPAKERETVMRELSFMGVTAGAMFPSIDGICEELREYYFDI